MNIKNKKFLVFYIFLNSVFLSERYWAAPLASLTISKQKDFSEI